MVDIEKVIYITAKGKGCIVHSEEHDYPLKESGNSFRSRASSAHLMRISKQHIVNRKYIRNLEIQELSRHIIRLKDSSQTELAVGRKYQSKLKSWLLG